MRFREMELGRGTLEYKGESEEYWAAKWRRGPLVMLVASIALILAGATFVFLSSYPGNVRIRPAQLTAVDSAHGTMSVTYVDGTAAPRTVTFHASPATTDAPLYVTLGAGSVRLGDQTGTLTVDRWSGIALIAIGVGLPIIARRRKATTPGPTGE